MTSYFISDLHLDDSRPAVTQAFYRCLKNWAGNCDALYILGDFFEAWVGDDDDAKLAVDTKNALRRFSNSGSSLYIMHGNRDFLLGEEFCAASGATLLSDPTLINLYGTPTLLMHGDSLCTDDHDYMAFRQQARSSSWQQQLLSQPLAARKALAKQLREQSSSMNALKANDIMDVNDKEVENALNTANCHRIIHGHTHRPKVHHLKLENNDAERWVLGDWCEKGWFIKATPDKLSLENFPL